MRHTVSKDDFIDFEFSQQMAGSFGRGENKELKAVVTRSNIMYQVIERGNSVLTTADIDEAIKKYNNI